jgi:serum/glucocorticoid-regulated kinase 2
MLLKYTFSYYRTGHTFTLDYYCLGALLYELVLGIPPYYSLNHEEIY